MEDYTKYKEAYDRDGFIVVKNFLPSDEFELIVQNVDRYVRDVVPSLPDKAAFYQDKSRPETLKQMQHMAGHDPFFEEYRKHPRWNALAEAVVGEPVNPQEPEWFNKPPGTEHATPPHQDNYYFKLRPPNVATLWLALDRVDEENGCLRYVPGTHRKGVRPHASTSVLGFSQGITDYGPEDESRERAVCVEPNDVVVHHGEAIHRADANRSADRQRRALGLVFYGVSARLDEEAHRKYFAQLESQHDEMGLKTSYKASGE